MDFTAQRLPIEDRVMLTLRGLFEQRGYARYRMSNFEGYDMYLAHRSFLKAGGVITFTDASGRLVALKPDVTMSIVKNTKHTARENKLYYIESVFRTEARGSDVREINQMGVEYIGGADGNAEAEVVTLAAQSLAAIHSDAVLNISHMSFVEGLLTELGMTDAQRGEAQAALRAKNAHALREIAAATGCGEAQANTLAAVASLAGKFPVTLQKARALCQNQAMHAAVDALSQLYETLCAIGEEKLLRLDFSAVNDIDYYNGIILQGYVNGVPRAVLSGGRYDRLMQRFGKPQAALGFAVYLSELDRAFSPRAEYDIDTLLLYSEAQQPTMVQKALRALLEEGKSVRAASFVPDGLRARSIIRLSADGERMEEVPC